MMQIRLLAHNVRSLWNVGSFFRTCDAMGVEHLYLTGYTGHPPRKEIAKTALGAEECVPWEHHTDPVPIVKVLKKEGWQIVALEQTTDATPLHKFPLPFKGEGTGEGSQNILLKFPLPFKGEGQGEGSKKILLLVGHELQGIPGNLLGLSDIIVEIPMLGKKESLNVAVAAGIALWHLRLSTPPDGRGQRGGGPSKQNIYQPHIPPPCPPPSGEVL